jgi:hypothetical protein
MYALTNKLGSWGDTLTNIFMSTAFKCCCVVSCREFGPVGTSSQNKKVISAIVLLTWLNCMSLHDNICSGHCFILVRGLVPHTKEKTQVQRRLAVITVHSWRQSPSPGGQEYIHWSPSSTFASYALNAAKLLLVGTGWGSCCCRAPLDSFRFSSP